MPKLGACEPPGHEAVSNADPSCAGAWTHLLEDYPEAVVRIAALRADKIQHLIFGWVELYPFDMKAPDSWKAGNNPWPVPGERSLSCTFSATKVPVQTALRWYEDVLGGRVNVALARAQPVIARSVQLAAEPAPGDLLSAVEVPFGMAWHDGPRIHRLVPMEGPSRALFRLSRVEKAREWLNTHLGFDPFRYDEWLGGAALLAPDPVCAAVSVFRSGRTAAGEETISVQIIPRRVGGRTADITKLRLHLAERRGAAWSVVETLAIPADGHAERSFRQPTGEVGHALTCEDRGLLRLMEPSPWWNQINIDMAVAYRTMNIEVPPDGRRKPASEYQVTQRGTERGSVIGAAVDDRGADRLRKLVHRRRSRERGLAAGQRVFGCVPSRRPPTSTEIEDKRNEAQAFVIGLVGKARRRLIFVDPFFGWRQMRLFALRNENEEVTPRILTGLQALKKMEGAPGFSHQQGGVFLKDLQNLSETLGSRVPLVRVMPGGDEAIIHDRYLIIDDEVWHCGPSFNEFGERLGIIVRLPEPASVLRLVARVWARSHPLEALSGSIR